MGKSGSRNVVLQPEAWYAVQGQTVFPLEDADLLRLLDNDQVQLDVFDSAPLYAKAMAAGGWGSSIVWDGKLAAYLLDASASKYHGVNWPGATRPRPPLSVRIGRMPAAWRICSAR